MSWLSSAIRGVERAAGKVWDVTPMGAINKHRRDTRRRRAAAAEADPTSDLNTEKRWAEAEAASAMRESSLYNALQGMDADTAARISSVANADVSRLDQYDPTDAYRTMATGAWDAARMDLASMLEELQESNAKTGRLNTGFFDADRGKVMTDVSRRFQQTVAAGALDAAGMDLQRRTAASQLVQGGRESALAAQLDRQRLGAGMYENEANRTRDMMAFNFDRNAANRQQRAMNRRAEWQTGINILGTLGGLLPGRGGR